MIGGRRAEQVPYPPSVPDVASAAPVAPVRSASPEDLPPVDGTGPRVPRRPPTRSGRLELLLLESCGVRFALPCTSVLERLPAVPVSPLPLAPPCVEGIVHVEGRLLPVLDVGRRLGLRRAPQRPGDQIVIAQAGTRHVALRSEGPALVLDLDAGKLEAPRLHSSILGDADGFTSLGEDRFLIHDLRAFLNEMDAAELDVALSAWETDEGPA